MTFTSDRYSESGKTSGAPHAGARESDPALDKRVVDFVEEFGIGLEATGLPRAAGRMLAWLIVCTPAEQTADDLATALSASAGGVSTNVRLLTQMQFVERVGKAGDRRSFYRLTPRPWSAVMAAQHQDTARLRSIAERGVASLAGGDPATVERLSEMRDFFVFMEREMPALIQRYNDEKGENR